MSAWLKLPCGCRASRDGEDVVIEAVAFMCAHRHPQGQRLTPIGVANLAVAIALDADVLPADCEAGRNPSPSPESGAGVQR